jgi:hypothetical protein
LRCFCRYFIPTYRSVFPHTGNKTKFPFVPLLFPSVVSVNPWFRQKNQWSQRTLRCFQPRSYQSA